MNAPFLLFFMKLKEKNVKYKNLDQDLNANKINNLVALVLQQQKRN